MLTPAPPGVPTPASGAAGGSQPPTSQRTRVSCSSKPPPTVWRVGAGVRDNRAMEYRSLGRTGMQVSPLWLGAMMFGAWGEPDHATCIKTIHAALDAGINFIDTADVYSQGESEIIVGKALADGKRDDVVLATKVNVQMGVPVDSPVGTKGDPNQRGNSRRWIIREVENSLRRLNTDWIDLYQVHRPDQDTDIEETLSALTDLQRQGKIRAFGSSTFPAHQMVQAQWVSERRALGRFVTDEPPYSLLVRGIEADVLPLAAADALGQLADGAGQSLIHLALAFVIQHPAVTSPIIGPRTIDHLQSQLS